jgi:hypothetical protein
MRKPREISQRKDTSQSLFQSLNKIKEPQITLISSTQNNDTKQSLVPSHKLDTAPSKTREEYTTYFLFLNNKI